MAFRIPFNENITIEVDTAAEVRALIAEFGGALSGVFPAVVAPPTGDSGTQTTERSKPRRAREVAPVPHQNETVLDDDRAELKTALVTILQQHGPMSPRDITARAGGDRYAVKYALKRLEHAGVVRAEGTTAARRWMLAKVNGHAHREPLPPAKEDH